MLKPTKQVDRDAARVKALPNNAPRNEQGLPYREAGDDCYPHYRFCEETELNYHRCG